MKVEFRGTVKDVITTSIPNPSQPQVDIPITQVTLKMEDNREAQAVFQSLVGYKDVKIRIEVQTPEQSSVDVGVEDAIDSITEHLKGE